MIADPFPQIYFFLFRIFSSASPYHILPPTCLPLPLSSWYFILALHWVGCLLILHCVVNPVCDLDFDVFTTP